MADADAACDPSYGRLAVSWRRAGGPAAFDVDTHRPWSCAGEFPRSAFES
ncbi:hypothetical protein [Oligoflexus sp.]